MITKVSAYMLLCLSVLFGIGSLLAYTLFLFFGSFNLLDRGLSEVAALGLNACLCQVFFIQHSIMNRRSFRRWLKKFIRADFHSAFYSIFSGVALLVLVVFWQESSHTLATVNGCFRWFLRAVFFLAVAGMNWGSVALGRNDTFGLYQILRYLRGEDSWLLSGSFVIRGPYRWVRHPLYMCTFIMIWSCPDLTSDRLLFNILFSVWIVVGIFFEERDLAADFGEEYLEYQRDVPMLIPYRIPH